MERLTENKIILIKRKTRLEDLIVRYNTVAQAKFYIEHLGADFSDYVEEDRQYRDSVLKACEGLSSLGRVQIVDREFLPNFIFGEKDLVVAIGQDGLVANTLKYLDKQLLVGVNPDPCRWDGVLLPFTANDVKLIVQDIYRSKASVKAITMAKATLNDGQFIFGVNDLFIGQKSHVSSRYKLDYNGKQELQSSSGIIVSTGLGSTGWFKSVLTGAAHIASSAFDAPLSLTEGHQFGWDSKQLYFAVREPFPSKRTSANLVFGKITNSSKLKVLSQMPENGIIFSDGIESDYLQFNSGVEATISVAEKKGHLVVR